LEAEIRSAKTVILPKPNQLGLNGRRALKMSKRSRDWNEGLSQDLRDPVFAKGFIIASLDEGLALQAALGKVIRAYGVKEFAKKVKMQSPNVLRAIDPRHNPTQETLNRLLKPFGLYLTVAEIVKTKKAS